MANKYVLLIILLLVQPFLLGGIMSVNPATDEEELIFIPPEKERNMGRKINKKVHERFDGSVDPLMQERIERIGEKLAAGSDRKDMVYRFAVLKDDEAKEESYNAFAVPGGYIYIFSDLVGKLKADDNIAGVLAHEMSHIEAKHSVKRLQGSIGVTALMLLGTQMKVEEGSGASLNAAIGHLMASYSRQDERQADELSVKYMRRAGFDPNGTVGALEVLRAIRKKAPRMKYSFLKSHPYNSERVAYLKNFIKGYADFDSYINIVSEPDKM